MTDTTKPSARSVPEQDVSKKKTYEPPRVVSHSVLEVVTAACEGEGAKGDVGSCTIISLS